MPRLGRVPADVRTVQLGAFTAEHAAAIADGLDARGIVWWSKEPGFLSRIWEPSVWLFVDRTKLDEARRVVAEVMDAGA